MGSMRLETKGMYLRPPTRADADALASAVRESLESVVRWMPWASPDYGRVHSLEWIGRSTRAMTAESAFEFVIFEAETDEILGCCGLNRVDPMNKRANLGYWVRQSRQGHGIAPVAALRVARFGFEERGLVRIEIVAASENLA